MNYLSKILAVIGMIIIYGAVTKSDYMYELHQDYSISQMIIQIIIGISFVIPLLIMKGERK